jgi:hypothetical protein
VPKATVDTEEVLKVELVTCPGAYVGLRRLPYGQWLKRQEMALQMKITGGTAGKEAGGELAMASRRVTEFEFQQCIVDHNLEDANGEPLDFRKAATLDVLDPKIGTEIGDHISQLHEFDSGNF